MMTANESLENLLYVQTQKLQDLETATELIQSKSFIREELLNAYEEVCNIDRGIQTLKEDVRLIKLGNERCKELSLILKSLDQQIQHMQQNIPTNIEEYIKSEAPNQNNQNTKVAANDYANNTINNNTPSCNEENINSREHTISDIKSCKKVLFNEPEIPYVQPIAEEEFSKIPKYIIGRYSMDSLNSLVGNINQIIKAKYSIIASGKNGARKKGELDAYLHYKKEQMTLGADEEKTHFFTAEDFEKYIKCKIDKTKLNLLIALRHCKRLREIRTAKTVNYALIL